MDKSTIVQRDTNLVYNELDGEVVMMSLEKGEYYGLNSIGSRIWEIIAVPTSIEELVRILSDEFEVSSEQCLSDVEDFVTDLIQKNVAHIVE